MKVIKSTSAVNQAIRNAGQLKQSLLPNKRPLKLQSGGRSVSSGNTYENGTMYLCEIQSEVSPGIFIVKRYLDMSDLSVYDTKYLVALDMMFENIYYPGQRILAGSCQLDSYTVTT